MNFTNKTVFITGGVHGIGRGCCDVFLQAGGNVICYDRDQSGGERLSAAANSERKNSLLFIAGDVADFSSLQSAIRRGQQHFGRLDCLINNAGVHPPATALGDFTIDQMEQLLRINFLSTYAASQAALPLLVQTKGTIVNISSMTAVLGQHLSTAYAATKGAQVSFTKALAIEAGHQGVRVNAVLPSNVDTPLMREWANTLEDPESALQRVADLQVFGRMAEPSEIGSICLFLACEESRFMTGQAIEADGGAALDY